MKASLFFVVALSCVAVCTSASVPTKICDSSCPDNWLPVCGTNSKGETVTFSNECEMVTWNCAHDTDFTHSFDGLCLEENGLCPEEFLCPDIYLPVCGTNSEGKIQNFSNKCEMDRWNCDHDSDYSILSNGTCPRVCNAECPDIYLPVCGTNSEGGTQTFSNVCEMELWNCNHDTDFQADDNTGCLNLKIDKFVS